MSIPGIQESEAVEPARSLPEDWTGKAICLALTGGVGDVLMAIGGTARVLKQKSCTVFAATMEHQKSLVCRLAGIDGFIRKQSLNSPAARDGFDSLIDFEGTFNSARQLKAQDYYGLVSERVGLDVGPGQFTFPYEPGKRSGFTSIALHPGASNPNRRWDEAKWEELAFELAERGFDVSWLGTKDEYGFNGERIHKLSDDDEDLLWQARELARCEYFVGTDSGFAHIAGILGMKGVVLFGNTCPRDVICRYRCLKGVHAFGRLETSPTRAIKPDEHSIECMTAITVEDVLKAPGFHDLKKLSVSREIQPPKRWKVAAVLHGTSRELLKHLRTFCKITELTNHPLMGSEYDAVIVETATQYEIKTPRHQARLPKKTPLENFRRAIREVSRQ